MRHEAAESSRPTRYHRAGGGLAAATATYGAGFTNTLTALAEAVQARMPLVLVVGNAPTSEPGRGTSTRLRGVGGRRPTFAVGRADAAATTIIAVEHALAHQVPTVLAIPSDVATLEAGRSRPARAAPAAPLAPDRASPREPSTDLR